METGQQGVVEEEVKAETPPPPEFTIRILSEAF
jgi:hypothetical protein